MDEGECCESCGRRLAPRRTCTLCRTPPLAPVDERDRARVVARHLAGRHIECECGYDLAGVPTNRCPECNQRYTVVTLTRTTAPPTGFRVPGPLAILLLFLALGGAIVALVSLAGVAVRP
jgi:hypothetical protein